MTGDDPLPISLVAHTVFCPRRAWLESVGETVASIAIEHGIADHRSVDERSDERTLSRRSVAVQHPGLGISGRCDVVDARSGAVQLVEFKSAPVRRSHEVTAPQRIQLALQRLCLEEAGVEVDGQAVHFTTSRKTVPVDLDAEDFERAAEFVALTRSVVGSTSAPEPLVDDPRCARCSHASVCLPEERQGEPVRRRVMAADAGGEVLHVTVPGSRVSMRKGRLVISSSDGELSSIPSDRPQSLVLHGNVDVSSAVLREFMWTQRPVVWASGRGQVMGYARSARSANGASRITQHVRSAAGDLNLARDLISAPPSRPRRQDRRRPPRDPPSLTPDDRLPTHPAPVQSHVPWDLPFVEARRGRSAPAGPSRS